MNQFKIYPYILVSVDLVTGDGVQVRKLKCCWYGRATTYLP